LAVVALEAESAVVALFARPACRAFGTVSLRGLIFAAVTAPFWSFFVATAPLRSCEVPTLLFGTLRAAYPVPPKATIRAMIEISKAGVGL
jgi:hypothetical protein